jgi:hypothetical protein
VEPASEPAPSRTKQKSAAQKQAVKKTTKKAPAVGKVTTKPDASLDLYFEELDEQGKSSSISPILPRV